MELTFVGAVLIFFGGFVFGKFVFSPRKKTPEEMATEQAMDEEAMKIKNALLGQEALDKELARGEMYMSIAYTDEDGKLAHLHSDIIKPDMRYNYATYVVDTVEKIIAERLAEMHKKGTYHGFNENEETVYVPAVRFIGAKVVTCE